MIVFLSVRCGREAPARMPMQLRASGIEVRKDGAMKLGMNT
jgi:hypothetical protein